MLDVGRGGFALAEAYAVAPDTRVFDDVNFTTAPFGTTIGLGGAGGGSSSLSGDDGPCERGGDGIGIGGRGRAVSGLENGIRVAAAGAVSAPILL